MAYQPTARTTPRRYRERAAYDADVVHGILDEALICHLGFTVDGEPRVLPTTHARLGDVLYLHGSTGSQPLLAAASAPGLPVCVTATLVDGIVFSRSAFDHSLNYRSVVALGTAYLVTDPDEKRAALDALVDHVAHGRTGDTRPPTGKELAATSVLALPLAEVSAKVRSGPAGDDPANEGLPYWAGVVPLRTVAGEPAPDPSAAAPTPAYLADYRRAPRQRSPWFDAVPLAGEHVRLEPLGPEHVDGLLKAGADPEVWRYLSEGPPATRDEMAQSVSNALHAHAQGTRVPWALIDAATGEVAGTTSYYEVFPEPKLHHLAIGYTWLGRPWWRTAINTEAKLLLLERAFDVLGAVRVTWHTDIRNERSQAAIARLGAAREGVLRHHRLRPDGTYRDTVVFGMTAAEWPAAGAALRARLERR